MLLGLHFDPAVSQDEKEETGIIIAKAAKKPTRVFESRNFEEFRDTIKKYKPGGRESFVFINTHYDFLKDDSLGHWRTTDIYFAQKGGVVYGEKPARETLSFQQRIRLDAPEHMVQTAEFYRDRVRAINDAVPGYFGRTDSDPHTIVFGFTPSWPKPSIIADALMSGLPDEWWQGVGFFNRRNAIGKISEDEAYQRAVDQFFYASRIAVSDKAHEVLTRLGVEHQVADPVRVRTLPEADKYGRKLRTLAKLDLERIVE